MFLTLGPECPLSITSEPLLMVTGLSTQLHEALSSLAHLFPLSANSSHLIAPVFQIHSRLQVLATLSLHFGLNPNRFLPSISSCALNCLSHVQSAPLKPGHWILAYGGIIHGAPCGLRQTTHLFGLINQGHPLLVQVNHTELNERAFHLSAPWLLSDATSIFLLSCHLCSVYGCGLPGKDLGSHRDASVCPHETP